MKHYLLIFTAIFTMLFVGCSGKKYFEPENVKDNLNLKINSIPSELVSVNRIGATLDDLRVVGQEGVSDFKLPEGFEFLNLTFDGKIIATDYKDELLIGNKKVKVEKPVVAASLKDDRLAVLYSDNSYELIQYSTNKSLLKEYSSASFANDTRIINPHFMGNLLLFPTLDGKIIIVSLAKNISIRTIAVDLEGEINNIIFLKVIEKDQTLIVASPNKIVSISPEHIVVKDYELRDVLVHGEDIYIATIDGQIKKLNPILDEIASKKFKYAKVLTLAFSKGNLFAVEAEGFVIRISEDFSKKDIYEFDVEKNEKIINLGNKIYFNSKEVELP